MSNLNHEHSSKPSITNEPALDLEKEGEQIESVESNPKTVELNREEMEALMCQPENNIGWKIEKLTIETVEAGKEYKISGAGMIPLETYKGHFKQEDVVPFLRVAQFASDGFCAALTFLSDEQKEEAVHFLKSGKRSTSLTEKFIAAPPKDKPVKMEGTIKQEEQGYVGDITVFVEDANKKREDLARMEEMACFKVPRKVLEDPEKHKDWFLSGESLLESYLSGKHPKLELWSKKSDDQKIYKEHNGLKAMTSEELTKASSVDRSFFTVDEAVYDPKSGSFFTKVRLSDKDLEGRYLHEFSVINLIRMIPPAALGTEVLVQKYCQEHGIIQSDKPMIPFVAQAGMVEILLTDKLLLAPCDLVLEAKITSAEKTEKGKDHIFADINIYAGDMLVARMREFDYNLMRSGFLDILKDAIKENKGRVIERLAI